MGNRLSRIVTRTGDDGSTGLGDGTRVPKDAARIEAMGSVDELNCTLGVLLSNELHDEPAVACPLLGFGRQQRQFCRIHAVDLGHLLSGPSATLSSVANGGEGRGEAARGFAVANCG